MGGQQLLSSPLSVPKGSLRFVMRGGLAWPGGVLELVALSPHCSKGPEPAAKLGTQGHVDYMMPA